MRLQARKKPELLLSTVFMAQRNNNQPNLPSVVFADGICGNLGSCAALLYGRRRGERHRLPYLAVSRRIVRRVVPWFRGVPPVAVLR